MWPRYWWERLTDSLKHVKQGTRVEIGTDRHAVGKEDPRRKHHIFYLPHGVTLSVTSATCYYHVPKQRFSIVLHLCTNTVHCPLAFSLPAGCGGGRRFKSGVNDTIMDSYSRNE